MALPRPLWPLYGLRKRAHFLAGMAWTLRRVVKSFVEGIHQMRTNPDLAKKAINKYMRLNGDRELEEAYQLLRRVTLTKPYPTIDGIKTILNDLIDQIPAAKTADPKDFVDTRFLEELDRSGYIDRLYR